MIDNNLSDEVQTSLVAHHPIGRLGQLHEVTALIAALARSSTAGALGSESAR